jgi:hypothetical protein
MRQTINDTQGAERLRAGLYAGAATVGRPSGVDGKNRVPRRPKMTAKETAKLNSKHFPDEIKKPLKAGGPGSGRHKTNIAQTGYKPPNRKVDKQSDKVFNKVIKQHGFKKDKQEGVFVKKSNGKYHVIVPLYSDHGNKTYVTQFRHSVTDKVANYDSESKYKKEGEPEELHDYLTKKGL